MIRSAVFYLCLLLPLASLAAQDAPVAITPEEVKWNKSGTLALPGIEQANLIGDPARPGPYTIRVKFPVLHFLSFLLSGSLLRDSFRQTSPGD